MKNPGQQVVTHGIRRGQLIWSHTTVWLAMLEVAQHADRFGHGHVWAIAKFVRVVPVLGTT